MNLRLTAVFLAIVGGTAGMTKSLMAAPTDEGDTRLTQTILQEKLPILEMPATPKELLKRIKRALEQGLFLHKDFYADENLKNIFGTGYSFSFTTPASDQIEVSFNDLGNVYVGDDGKLTQLGQNRPCLQGGRILFEPSGNGHKARASMALSTSARIIASSSIYADFVKEIFGDPNSVTEGYPTAPPLHGRPYIPEAKTHDLGNSWISYLVEGISTVNKIKFRTLGDAVIVEIQIIVGEK